VGDKSWIFPVANPTNGGGVLFRCANFILSATNGGVNANGAGFAGGWYQAGKGPGGSVRGGGGYGGVGGAYAAGYPGGPVYGTSTGMLFCGSGGGGADARATLEGGSGGGLVWIEVSNAVRVDGTLSANGFRNSNYGGGGSGGGIAIRCIRFDGASSASIVAAGGMGGAGSVGSGGGGGRVRITRATRHDTFAGDVSASGGLGGYQNGNTGSVVRVDSPCPGGTLIQLR
jgi:hypothetical protein